MASICSHSHRLLHIRSQTKADISNETFQENDDSLKAVWFNVSIRVGGGKFVVETLPTAQVNGTNQVLSKYYLLSTVSKRQE